MRRAEKLHPYLVLRYTGIICGVVDPNTLNLDPYPELWSNLDTGFMLPVPFLKNAKNSSNYL